MRFARIVFIGAGIWGIVVLTPLYGLVDLAGRSYQPPMEYPHFFYGFLGVALAWQVAFLLIGFNPARYRPIMLAAVLEKVGFVVPTAVLYVHGRLPWIDAQAAVPDLLLGTLFVIAYLKTRVSGAAPRVAMSRR